MKTGCLMAVGQQSGKASRASRAIQAIRYSRATCNRANRALDAIGPIGQVGQSGQSGKLTNRAIGQNGQSGNWKIKESLQEGSSHHLFCPVAHLAGLLLTWPDSSPCQTGPTLSCQTDSRPDWCQIGVLNRASRAVERQTARLPLGTQIFL